MKKPAFRMLLPLLLCLLCLCLFPCAAMAASAEAVLGDIYAEPWDYQEIESQGGINANSPIGTLLRWLNDYLDDEMGYTVTSAMDLSTLAAAVPAGDSAAYRAQIAASGEFLRQANDLDAEMQFYRDRLYYCYRQCTADIEDIRRGDLSKEEQDALLKEVQEITSSTEPYRQEAIKRINGTSAQAAGKWAERNAALTNQLDATRSPWIADLRDKGLPVLRQRAAALETGEMSASAVPALQPGADPIIKVISENEFAVSLGLKDVRSGDQKLAGFHIWVRRYDAKNPGPWIKATTDNTGAVVFNRMDFKPNRSGAVDVEIIYNADSVTLDANGLPKGVGRSPGKEGYVRREMGHMTIKGGEFYHMLLPADSGKPYVVRATFNNLDMFNVDNGMWLTSANNAAHTIALKLDNKGKKMNFDVWQYWGTTHLYWRYIARAVFNQGEQDAKIFVDTFCKPSESDKSHAFVPGKALYFTIEEPSKATASGPMASPKEEANFKTTEAANDNKEGKSEKDTPMSDNLEITLPDSIPIIGGAKLKIPSSGKVKFYIELGKSIKIAYNWPIKPEALKWESEDQKAQDERLKEEKERVAAGKEKAKSGLASEYAQHQKKPFLGSAQCSVTPYIFVMSSTADVKENVQHYDGSLNAGVVLAFNYEFTKEFLLGAFPAYIGMDFEFKLTLGLGAGVQFDFNNKTENYTGWDWSSKSGLAFHPHLEIGLTVGAGLPKVLYVALRGSGWLDMDAVLGHGDKPKVEVGLKAEVKVKAFVFEKSWTLWEKKWPNGIQDYYTYVFVEDAEYDPPLLTYEEAGLSAVLGDANPVTLDNATERNIIDALNTGSSDVKYVTIKQGNSNTLNQYAFWVGPVKNSAGKTVNRVQYMNLDATNPQIYIVNRDHGGTYIYGFDVDYRENEAVVHYCIGDGQMMELNPKDRLDQTRYNLRGWQRRNPVRGVIQLMTRTGNGDELTMGVMQHYDNAGYMNPRVRFLTSNHTVHGRTMIASFGAVNVEVGMFAVNGGVFHSGGGDCTKELIQLWHGISKNGVPDYMLMSYLGTCNVEDNTAYSPVILSLETFEGQYLYSPMKFVTYEKLNRYLTGIRKLQNKFINMKPMRQLVAGKLNTYYTGGATGMIFGIRNGVQNREYTFSAAILYLEKFEGNHMHTSTFKNHYARYTIKDMGVVVSSDGMNTVNVLVNSKPQLYGYWVQAKPGERLPGKEKAYKEDYYLNACLIDTEKKLCTPTFDWVKLQRKGANIHLKTSVNNACEGYYLYNEPVAQAGKTVLKYGIRKLDFKLAMNAAILAFDTQYPVVCQGKPFNFYIRFKNTGSLVIRGFDINIDAENVANKTREKIKDVHVDVDNPLKNQVTSYDYGDDGNGVALTGEHAVYRMFDVNDLFNGNTVITEEYVVTDDDSPAQGAPTVEMLPGLLPEAVATYKSTVKVSPTKWKGNYRLHASIAKYYATAGMGDIYADPASADYEPLYVFLRQPDDSFKAFLADPNTGAAVGNELTDLPVLCFSVDARDAAENNNLGVTADLSNRVAPRRRDGAGVYPADQIYANINHNDLKIGMDHQLIDGEDYVLVNLHNDAYQDGGAQSAGVIPKLTTVIDNKVVSTIPLKTELDGGFGRMVYMKLSDLTGGRVWNNMDVIITSENTANSVILNDEEGEHETAYGELNLLSNTENVRANLAFWVSDPEDATVFEGQDATFKVLATGESDAFTYQWHAVYPDGTDAPLVGATTDTLVLPKAQLSQSGMRYWVRVSDGVHYTDTAVALLTVTVKPPVTGDGFPAEAFALLGCLSAGLCALLLFRRRRA